MPLRHPGTSYSVSRRLGPDGGRCVIMARVARVVVRLTPGGGRTVRESVEHVLGCLKGHFADEIAKAKPPRPDRPPGA